MADEAPQVTAVVPLLTTFPVDSIRTDSQHQFPFPESRGKKIECALVEHFRPQSPIGVARDDTQAWPVKHQCELTEHSFAIATDR
jgi:hypothetical protein